MILVLASFASIVLAQPLEIDSGASAKLVGPRYRIGIIDTGYNPEKATTTAPIKLCKSGHYDYMTKTENLAYVHRHGTMIMNLIAEKLKDVDYCFVVYQIMSDGSLTAATEDIASALLKAASAKLTAVNISLNSGKGESAYDEKEELAYKAATANGVVVFLASGNAGVKLNKKCDWYPVCYGPHKNLVIVGGRQYENPKEVETLFNYGPRISVYAPSHYVDGDVLYRGTSYAAPRALAEYILFLEYKRLGK